METFFKKHPGLYLMFVIVFCFLVVWYIHQPATHGTNSSTGFGRNGVLGIQVPVPDHESGQENWIRDPR